MRVRFSMLVSSAAFAIGVASFAHAEDRIQAVNSNGRIVFTNLVDNTPQASSTAKVGTEAAVEGMAGSASRSDEVPANLKALVDNISTRHGVDPALVHAVIKTESNFNRWAVSSKGALGLMQLIPSTGQRYGVRDFFDPQQNIDGGVRYLKFLLAKFKGNLDLSLAAYNAGENLVERLGRIPSIPETRNYVQRIRAIYSKKFTAAGSTDSSAVMATASVPQPSKLFKIVDGRGVVHFSNIEPPN